MPVVPMYDTPQVEQTALPVSRFDAPAIPPIAGQEMEKMGHAAVGLGNSAVKMASKIEDDANDAQTKQQDNMLADNYRQILYDKDTGYLNQIGKHAVDMRKDTVQALRDANNKAAEGLTNQAQKLMFASVAEKRLQAALTHVDVHAAQQTQKWNEGETVARVKSSVADAVANSAAWSQPGSAFATAKATALDEAKSLAQTRGYDKAQTDQLIAETAAGLHGTVLSNMVSLGQSRSARDYLEKFAPEIAKGAPDQLDNMRNLVKQAGVKEDSLNLSFSLKGDLKSQISSVDAMFKRGDITAEVRDATVARAEHNWAQREAKKNDGDKAAMGAAQDWILKNPGKSIMDMPTNLYNWAKGTGHLAGLDGFAQREGRPGERLAELKTRGALVNLATTDPDAFVAEFKRTQFSDRFDLGANGIKEMQNIAGDMLRGNGKYHATFDNNILQDAIPESILKNKDKKDSFIAIMAEEGDKWKKANPGKVPDQGAYQQVIKAANSEWISVGKVWNSTEKAYQVRGQANAVPAEFYNGMKKAGASEAEILSAWKLKNGTK